MSRAKRLQLVLDMAAKAEDKAAEALELARQLKLTDEQKLAELCQYYEDYEISFRRPQTLIRAEEMLRQRGFLMQLSEAKEQQSQVVEKRTVIFTNKQQLWQVAHLKRKSMQDLVQRLQSDEDRLLSRREEKMLEEWFTQTASQRENSSLFP